MNTNVVKKYLFSTLIKISSLLLLILLFNVSGVSQDIKILERNKIKGRVIDFETKKPVSSATIRLDNTNNGTIATSDGEFMLPKGWFGANTKIRVSSVGYKTEYFELDLRKDSVEIKLKQNPVLMDKATIIGNIEVEEIIRRAIARKQENRLKYNTLQCKSYTKLRLNLDEFVASVLDGVKNTNNGDLQVTISTEEVENKNKNKYAADFMKNFIIENISQRYIDVEKDIDKTIIVKRRQTANLPTEVNNLSLDEFNDFTDNEIQLVDAKIITPLNDKALNYYKYELLERKYADTNYIYVIKVIPNTSVYPTFTGTISIIEGTYQLIAVNLKPSMDTKIYAIEDLEYIEVFENIGNDIWYPTHYENKAVFNLKLLPFIPPMKFNWNANSVVSNIIINEPLPDSIMIEDTNTNIASNINETINNQDKRSVSKTTIINKDADSIDNEYWNENSLIILTEEEKEIYEQIDTAAKELNIDMNSDSMKANNMMNMDDKKFDWDLELTGRYNRVESYYLGGNINAKLPYTLFTIGTGYTYGQHRWWYNGGIKFGNFSHKKNILFLNFIPPTNKNKVIFDVGANIFSSINPFGDPFKEKSLTTNTIDFYIFGRDYFDYYRNDGWSIFADLDYSDLKFNITYKNVKNFSLNKTTDYTLFTNKKFRENPQTIDINQQFITLNIEFGNKITLNNDKFQYFTTTNFLYNIEKNQPYNIFKASTSVQFPVMETGYGKLLLYLAATGGVASKNTARHHLFVVEQSSTLFHFSQTEENTFITAYNSNLGGNTYFSLHLQLHLKDWLWRWLHLPRIQGRGLDMSLIAASARFFTYSDANDGFNNNAFYTSTINDFYTECGLRLGRIPIPGTDLLFWSIEGRAGVGKYAEGRWGVLINLNLPFSFDF